MAWNKTQAVVLYAAIIWLLYKGTPETRLMGKGVFTATQSARAGVETYGEEALAMYKAQTGGGGGGGF